MDTKAATALAAPVIVAGIEDSIVVYDKDSEENATHPASVKIICINCPICQTHTFLNLKDLNVKELQEG
jgi:hypothetical protein